MLAVALIERGDPGGALATGAGLLAGAAAYAAIFTWAGLASRQALLIGLVYVFIWEAALAAYLDGIRFLSVRRYTLALINGLDSDRLASVNISLAASTALDRDGGDPRRLHRARDPEADAAWTSPRTSARASRSHYPLSDRDVRAALPARSPEDVSRTLDPLPGSAGPTVRGGRALRGCGAVARM